MLRWNVAAWSAVALIVAATQSYGASETKTRTLPFNGSGNVSYNWTITNASNSSGSNSSSGSGSGSNDTDTATTTTITGTASNSSSTTTATTATTTTRTTTTAPAQSTTTATTTTRATTATTAAGPTQPPVTLPPAAPTLTLVTATTRAGTPSAPEPTAEVRAVILKTNSSAFNEQAFIDNFARFTGVSPSYFLVSVTRDTAPGSTVLSKIITVTFVAPSSAFNTAASDRAIGLSATTLAVLGINRGVSAAAEEEPTAAPDEPLNPALVAGFSGAGIAVLVMLLIVLVRQMQSRAHLEAPADHGIPLTPMTPSSTMGHPRAAHDVSAAAAASAVPAPYLQPVPPTYQAQRASSSSMLPSAAAYQQPAEPHISHRYPQQDTFLEL